MNRLSRFDSARVFIFITVFVDIIGYGIVIPLLPLYVERQFSGGTIVGLMGALYAGAQALGGPVLAGISDRCGRRPVLVVSLLGTSTAYLLLGLADTLPLLVAAILLDGITGGNLSTAQAYIADTTTDAERAAGFGMIGAAFGLGIAVGPALGGLLSAGDLHLPAFVASGIALCNALFGLFVLPESLPPERRHRAPLLTLNPVSQLFDIARLQGVRPLLLVVLLLNLAFSGLQTNFPLFSKARFNWNAATNAYFYAFVGTCAVLTQGVLLGRLRRYVDERPLALTGLLLMAVNLLLMAIAPASWMLFPIVGLLALGSNLAIPTITSILSSKVGPDRQGHMMGSLQTVLNLALIGGPLIAGISFDRIGIAAPYTIGGVIIALALAVAWTQKAA